MNQHDGDVLTLQFPFLHIKRWKGQDVAVSANRCEVLEELIGHRDTCRLATVIDPHEEDTHIAVIRQIVGESTTPGEICRHRLSTPFSLPDLIQYHREAARALHRSSEISFFRGTASGLYLIETGCHGSLGVHEQTAEWVYHATRSRV